MTGIQLELFGCTVTEDEFISELWGRLQFYHTKSDSVKETCRKCLLFQSIECGIAKCQADERQDHRNGYYSIHQMPKERNVVLPH